MKIAYLINGMFNAAGRERVVANKACFFTARGHQITIITTDQHSRPYYYPVPESTITIDLDINNDRYAAKPIHKKVISFLKNDRLFKERLSHFLRENPQDIIVTLEDRFIPALFSLVDSKTVLVAESHFNRFAFKEIGKSVNRSLIQRIVYSLRSNYVKYRYYKKLDAYVLLTQEDYEYWTYDKKNVYVIPNSISYDSYKHAQLDNKIVIAVGRLSYQKGFERLIDSWSIVSQHCYDWNLHIYGDGEDKELLLERIKEQKLENKISILPPTPYIEQKLLEASIYVLSSRFEGLPMILLESMSYGLPIVSYDCKTGPKDLIKDGYNGYLVQEGDIEALANKIISLIKNEVLRRTIGRNSKIEAEKYSHEKIAERWENLFNALISNKK